MNDEELIELLKYCCGMDDRKFALHPEDSNRAFELLIKLRKKGIGLSRVQNCMRNLLSSQSKDHIDKQLKEVKTHYGPWLLD